MRRRLAQCQAICSVQTFPLQSSMRANSSRRIRHLCPDTVKGGQSLTILAALTLESPISVAISGSPDARDVVKRGTMEVGVATGFWQATTLWAMPGHRIVVPRSFFRAWGSLSPSPSEPSGGEAMSKCWRNHVRQVYPTLCGRGCRRLARREI